jgi:hypothetical protein
LIETHRQELATRALLELIDATASPAHTPARAG